jgi:hypothetical protein
MKYVIVWLAVLYLGTALTQLACATIEPKCCVAPCYCHKRELPRDNCQWPDSRVRVYTDYNENGRCDSGEEYL